MGPERKESAMPVVNPIPREKAHTDVAGIYDSLTKKFGRMPNIFANMAHRPAVLKNFLALYASVMNEGTVEPKLKELAYLKTSRLNGCEYCYRAHAASGKPAGVTDEQLRSLEFYRSSKAFNEKEKAVILYAERLTRGAAGIREGSLAELRKHLSEDQIVELTLVICMANFTNRFNDALEAEPDVG
jgi:uncharacterized peroxidase-related enzyme